MARYSLIAKNIISNEEFIIKLKTKFKDKLQEKVELYEIDLLTSNYKNKVELLNALKDNKCIDFNYGDVYISYNYDGIRKLEPIYNDLLLKICAAENYNKKLDQNGRMRSDIRGFDLFTTEVLKVVKDEKQYDFFMNHRKIDKYLQECLLSYKKLSNKNFLTMQEVSDLRQVENDIKNRLLKYNVFRNVKTIFIEYERFKKVLKSKKVLYKNNDYKIKYNYDTPNPYKEELYPINQCETKEEFLTDDERKKMIEIIEPNIEEVNKTHLYRK